MQTYYTPSELARLNLKSLPKGANNIRAKLIKLGVENRPREARGGGVEYLFDSLPENVQTEIQIKVAKAVAKEQAKKAKAENNQPKQANYLPEVIWSSWEKATSKQKAKAEKKAGTCFAVDDLANGGMGLVEAIEKVSSDTGVSKGSLKRWYYKVRGFERCDWLPLLLGNYHKCAKRHADFSEEAWEAFKADYLRLERPQLGACYDRLLGWADEHGWSVPSLSTIQRKLNEEVPKTEQVLLREGEHKLFEMYPSLIRTVENIEACEWVNGDGYKHNVFVEFPDGDITRPVTWFWQDVRTRKILAFRTDKTENSDMMRLSLMDLIYKYCIPSKATIDNTRAAANKTMTGGVANRYRFKVKKDDPDGIMKMLGIKVYWTSVNYGKGHGQAKPIERAFGWGGIGEHVDKHPLLRGHNTGGGVKDKPANYQGNKRGASYEDFITALEQGVAQWNNKEKRDTELCNKVYSFNQVFERDFAKAKVRKATDEHLRLLMLQSEAVTLHQNGTFWSNAGGGTGQNRNRYEAVDLIGSKHKKVVIRFDPQKLHETVLVYTLDGRFLAEAVCTQKAGFGDTSKARELKRVRTQFVKANKASAKAKKKMTDMELAKLSADIEVEEEIVPIPSITELVVAQGNTLKKQVTVSEAVSDEELQQYSDDWVTGIHMVIKELNDDD